MKRSVLKDTSLINERQNIEECPQSPRKNHGETRTPPSFKYTFNDPFLAYVYMASIPFFVALYQHSRCWAT